MSFYQFLMIWFNAIIEQHLLECGKSDWINHSHVSPFETSHFRRLNHLILTIFFGKYIIGHVIHDIHVIASSLVNSYFAINYRVIP